MSWCVDGQNITTKAWGCWRYQQLAEGVKTPFPKLFADMGAYNERLYREYLQEKGETFEEEVPFKIDLGDGDVVSGRCDFLLDGRVDELKSSSSKHAKAKWSKGGFDANHLAQHCLYLSHFGKPYGYLVYGKYQENKAGDMVKTYGKRFKVEVREDGGIVVDGGLQAVAMHNLVEYITAAVKWRKSETLAPAPQLDDPTDFRSPCRYCKLAPLCASASIYDKVADHREEARRLLQIPDDSPPKLTRTNLKKFQRKEEDDR